MAYKPSNINPSLRCRLDELLPLIFANLSRDDVEIISAYVT